MITRTAKSAMAVMVAASFVISATSFASTSISAFTPSLIRYPLSSSSSSSPSFKFNNAATMATAATAILGKNTALAMFTGIVEEIGTVINMQERNDMTLWDGTKGKGTELTVRGDVAMEGAYLGCSICVSGVCLTATVLDTVQNHFTVGLAPETLDKTYFKSLCPGQAVNLERASEIGGRNSGHFVQGHVDGTGTIVDKRIDGDSLRITIQVDDEFADDIVRYVVPKGFIAIDGTSLTVVDVDPVSRTFTFMLVEYTQKKIIIPQKSIGEKVNLEVDVLGKYSETALSSLLPRLEALEAKVESLERQLSSNAGKSVSENGGNNKQQSTRLSSSSSSTVAATKSQKPKQLITEGTPTFKDNIGDQGGLTVDPNTYMVRPERRGSGSSNDDDDDEKNGSVRRVNLTPDPKMDENRGINGDGFVTISGG